MTIDEQVDSILESKEFQELQEEWATVVEETMCIETLDKIRDYLHRFLGVVSSKTNGTLCTEVMRILLRDVSFDSIPLSVLYPIDNEDQLSQLIDRWNKKENLHE